MHNVSSHVQYTLHNNVNHIFSILRHSLQQQWQYRSRT